MKPTCIALALVATLAACSNGSASAPDEAGTGAASKAPPDAAGVSLGASMDSSTAPPDASGGAEPAGQAGADAFCENLCDHARACSAFIDASPPGLATCLADCQSANESSSANPPTELLRRDYVAELGSCIAAASCSDTLAASEAACGAAIVYGGDAGFPALQPTQAVAIFCHDLETSPCFARDAGVADCETVFMPYSDPTLNAAIACFSGACSDIGACYGAAFTQ